jgi:hypothetical protein
LANLDHRSLVGAVVGSTTVLAPVEFGFENGDATFPPTGIHVMVLRGVYVAVV